MTASITAGYAYQIGWAKQTNGQAGTLQPTMTNWPKWQQGSYVVPHVETIQYFEGDGSINKALNVKTGQWATAVISSMMRPAEVGQCFAALSGKGSDTVTPGTPTTHTIAPPAQGFATDYYTLTANMTTGAAIQIEDAICHQIHVTASAQDPGLKVESSWIGRVSQVLTSTSTATFSTDGPYTFQSSSGNWALNSALFGANNANWQAAVHSFDWTWQRTMNPQMFAAENPSILTPFAGNLTCSGTIEFFWQDNNPFASMFYGGGTSDFSGAGAVVYGQTQVGFAPQTPANKTLTMNFPNSSFKNITLTPQLSGDPLMMQAEMEAFKFTGAFAYQVIVLTSDTAVY